VVHAVLRHLWRHKGKLNTTGSCQKTWENARPSFKTKWRGEKVREKTQGGGNDPRSAEEDFYRKRDLKTKNTPLFDRRKGGVEHTHSNILEGGTGGVPPHLDKWKSSETADTHGGRKGHQKKLIGRYLVKNERVGTNHEVHIKKKNMTKPARKRLEKGEGAIGNCSKGRCACMKGSYIASILTKGGGPKTSRCHNSEKEKKRNSFSVVLEARGPV